MTWTSSLFEGKQVLVAGGTSGIGAATASGFARLGAEVLAVGLPAQDADGGPSADVRVQESDLTDASAAEALIASLSDSGRADRVCRHQP